LFSWIVPIVAISIKQVSKSSYVPEVRRFDDSVRCRISDITATTGGTIKYQTLNADAVAPCPQLGAQRTWLACGPKSENRPETDLAKLLC
jgi:hypothetical protein